MRVYLDNCSYNRPFDDQGQMRIFLEAQAKIHIQGLIIDGAIDLVCSYMSVYENNDNPHEEHRESIADFLQNAVDFVNYDKADTVEKRADQIMKSNIKHKDAIHISCAVEAGCGYFITTDDEVLRKYKNTDIIVIDPIKFITILEEANA
jgi:predicted nucleic acid-binding protein